MKTITNDEYLNKYLNDWKDTVSDLFTEDMLQNFLDIKKAQFDLKSYKKQLKTDKAFMRNIKLNSLGI